VAPPVDVLGAAAAGFVPAGGAAAPLAGVGVAADFAVEADGAAAFAGAGGGIATGESDNVRR